jgi:peptidoglycan/LPS O-acetylase OafA/YrhL
MTLATAPQWRGPNLHHARLVCAGLVAVYHAFLLTGQLGQSGVAMGLLSLGAELGVEGFFVISGMLVLASFQRATSLADYAAKRARRLLPAYLTVVVACAFMAVVMAPEARADLGGVFSYLGWNLIFANFMAPEIPGLFSSHPISAVNGSLWTIKIEIGFYLLLPVLMAIGARSRLHFVLYAMWLGAIVYVFALSDAVAQSLPIAAELPTQLAHQLPAYLGFFAAGMAVWHWREGLRRRVPTLMIAGAVMLVLSFFETIPFFRPLAMGALIAAIALARRQSDNPFIRGDISYGLYLVHFPVVQLIVASPLGLSVWSAIAGLAVSLGLAILLWHVVEKPALRPNSAYRRVIEKEGKTHV